MSTQIFTDLPIDDYHASDFVSNSKLQTFLRRGPRAYWMRYVHKSLPKEDTQALRAGSAFDTLLFDGEQVFRERFVERPAGMKFTTKAGKAWKKEQDEAGLVVIEPEDARAFEWMCAAIREHELANDLLHACDTQVSLRGAMDGLPGIQARPDGLCLQGCAASDFAPYVLDLKTTAELDQLTSGKSVVRYCYHQQMAFSQQLLRAHGIPELRYYLLAVEKTGAHRAQVIELTQDYVDLGERQITHGLQRLAAHYRTNTWPRVTEDVVVLEPPPWMNKEASAPEAA